MRGDRSLRKRQDVLLKRRRNLAIRRRGISRRRRSAELTSKMTPMKTIVHDHRRRKRLDIRSRKKLGHEKRQLVLWIVNANALKLLELSSVVLTPSVRPLVRPSEQLLKETYLRNGMLMQSTLGNTCRLHAEKLCQISSPVLACPRELIPLLLLHLRTKSDMLLQHDNTVTMIRPNVRLREGKRGELRIHLPHEVAKSQVGGDHQLPTQESHTLSKRLLPVSRNQLFNRTTLRQRVHSHIRCLLDQRLKIILEQKPYLL
jgi:hypothetical protein